VSLGSFEQQIKRRSSASCDASDGA